MRFRRLLEALSERAGRRVVVLVDEYDKSVYLFEFKVAERSAAGAALAQLQARGYADKHRAPGRAVHLVGVETSAESRDVVAFDAITCPADRSEQSPGA